MIGNLPPVDRVFKENILIGNYDFSEDEYSEMLDHVGSLHDNFSYDFYGFVFHR